MAERPRLQPSKLIRRVRLPPHGPLLLTERRSPLTKCRQSPSAGSPQGRREERRVGTGACPCCLLDMSARWSGRLAAFRTIDQASDASCPAKGGERSSVPVHLPISAPEMGVSKELHIPFRPGSRAGNREARSAAAMWMRLCRWWQHLRRPARGRCPPVQAGRCRRPQDDLPACNRPSERQNTSSANACWPALSDERTSDEAIEPE